MTDRKSLEYHAVDGHRSSHRHAPRLMNGKAMQQIQCLLGRVDGARRAFGKAEGMIEVCVRQHDRCGRNAIEPAQPVCATIDHDAGITMLDEQRAVASMATRMDFNSAACAEKRHLHRKLNSWRSDGDQAQWRLISAEMQNVLYVIIAERPDHRCCKTERDRLQHQGFGSMPCFEVNVTVSTASIFHCGAMKHCSNTDERRRRCDPILASRRDDELLA